MSAFKGLWKTLSPLSVARSHPATVAFKDKIYVFGGGGPNFLSLNDCVSYDPKLNKWDKLKNMPTKRSGTAGFLINDKIYIVGGGYKKPDGNFQFLKTVEIYDPNTDSWTQGPDMLQPHDYPAAALHENHIYIFGGHHPDACLGGPKTDPGFNFSERWSPGEEKWEEIPALPTPRFAASAVIQGNNILTNGGVAFRPEGFNNFDFFECYDTEKKTWSESETLKLPWPAAGHGMCQESDNFFFFGGYSTDNIHDRSAVYSTTTSEWDRLPDMPSPRAAMGVARIDNTIYLIGGWEDDGRMPLDSVVSYTWTHASD